MERFKNYRNGSKNHKKGNETKVEKRYYISSLMPIIELFSKAVRQHWSVEIMHWHLDVTFKEDANTTLNKDGTTVKFIIGSTEYSINVEVHTLDIPAEIYGDKTYIPFRAADEVLGIEIAYNPTSKNITFSY